MSTANVARIFALAIALVQIGCIAEPMSEHEVELALIVDPEPTSPIPDLPTRDVSTNSIAAVPPRASCAPYTDDDHWLVETGYCQTSCAQQGLDWRDPSVGCVTDGYTWCCRACLD